MAHPAGRRQSAGDMQSEPAFKLSLALCKTVRHSDVLYSVASAKPSEAIETVHYWDCMPHVTHRPSPDSSELQPVSASCHKDSIEDWTPQFCQVGPTKQCGGLHEAVCGM